MNTYQREEEKKTFGCETCPWREKAEADPKTPTARLWRWHTTWCPGWREYQVYLVEQAYQS